MLRLTLQRQQKSRLKVVKKYVNPIESTFQFQQGRQYCHPGNYAFQSVPLKAQSN